MGEVLALEKLLEKVRGGLRGVPVFLSVTTLAGRDAARRKLAGRVDGIFFAPLDFAFAVRRVLRRLRPTLVVIAETEIWPNYFREARRTGAGVMVVNGRISDRARSRYFALRPFFRAVLDHASLILVQTEEMRLRFIRTGANAASVLISGNLKYDFEPVALASDSPVRAFFAGAKVFVAASTSSDGRIDEEDIVLAAFALLPGWKLLLAPRKPERFEEVAHKLERAGFAFTRRSHLSRESRGDVLLLDTIGELASLFEIADVVFMGGTLANRGGHNILEPAFFAKPIIIGPHMENFREMAEEFVAARGVCEIASANALADAVLTIDPEIGPRGRDCALGRRGSVDRTFAELCTVYARSWSCRRRSLPALIALWPLAKLWTFGGARKRRNDLWRQKRLPGRVISIGNITVGGTGKTPHVLHVARRLQAAGLNPAILTRGYGRRSPVPLLALAPGEECSVNQTGDEAQILLRSGTAALGIGANRYAAGRMLAERFGSNVFILDDGFQHLRLARDLDIVLIDALNPFGECEAVPLGRLREPMQALTRASAFVITRAGRSRSLPAIEGILRQHNPWAPVFRSHVKPEEWIEMGSGARYPARALPFTCTMAFCGIGNPESFWRTLRDLGITPLDTLQYGDHHLYTPREIRRFGQLGQSLKAEALLTTEKDAMNLCAESDALARPLKLLYLRIGVEIENEEEFFRLLT